MKGSFPIIITRHYNNNYAFLIDWFIIFACIVLSWLHLDSVFMVPSIVHCTYASLCCVVFITILEGSVSSFAVVEHPIVSEVDNDRRTCLHAAACGGLAPAVINYLMLIISPCSVILTALI